MNLFKIIGKIVFPAFSEVIWHLGEKEKKICLSFDDGPNPEITHEIVKILNDHNVSALFFFTGKNIYKNRRKLAELDFSNHKIGNHAFSHNPLICKSKSQLIKEIRITDYIIKRELGSSAEFYRPPYGIFNNTLLKLLKSENKKMVLWSLLSNDFKWNSNKVLDHLCSRINSGDIVVFHDNPRSSQTTIRVLPDFIRFARQNKFQFSLI